MFDVFVSYARLDGSELAFRVARALEQRGRSVWIDKDDIPPAVAFTPELRRGVDGSDAFLVVVTERSMSPSSVCRVEIEHAVARGKRIVPVRWSATHSVPLPESTPKEIAELNIIGIDAADGFEHDVDAIVAGLDLDLDWVREHTRLLLRAVDWLNHGRTESWLLRGEDLEGAQRWLAAPPMGQQAMPSLSATTAAAARLGADPLEAQRQLIEASRQRADRERDATVASRMAAMSSTAFSRGPSSLPLATRLALESLSRNSTPEAFELANRCRAILPVPIYRVAHDATVSGVAAGAGRLVVTVDAAGAVNATDSTSGERLWAAHEDGPISLVELSTDGELLALSVEGHGLSCLRARTGERIGRLEHHEQVGSLRVSGDGRYVLASSGLGVGPEAVGPSTVRLFDLGRERECNAPSRFSRFAGALFHPTLATAAGPAILTAADESVRLVDIHGEVLAEAKFGGDRNPVVHIAVSANRPWAAVSTFSGTLRLIDIAQGREVMSTELGAMGANSAFSPHGSRLASLAGDGTVIVWEIDGWTILARVPARNVHTVRFGRDDDTLVLLDYHAGVRVWGIAPLRERHRIANVHPARIAVSPDDGRIVFAHDDDQMAWIAEYEESDSWRPHDSGSPLSIAGGAVGRRIFVGGERPDPTTPWVSRERPRPGFVASCDMDFRAAAVSETKRIAAVVGGTSSSGIIAIVGSSIVELRGDGVEPNVLYESSADIAHVASSRDATCLAILESDGTALVLDTRSSDRRRLEGGKEPWAALAISGDGRVVAGRTADGLALHDARTGERDRGVSLSSKASHAIATVPALALSADGEWVAVADGTNLIVFEARSGRLVTQASHQWAAKFVQFGLIGAIVVSASATSVGADGGFGDLRALDAATGRLLLESTLNGSALALALTSNGAHAACATDVGGIALFSVVERSGLIGSLHPPEEPDRFRALAFLDDDNLLVAASGNRLHRFRWRERDIAADVARRLTVEPLAEVWSHVTGGEAYRVVRYAS